MNPFRLILLIKGAAFVSIAVLLGGVALDVVRQVDFGDATAVAGDTLLMDGREVRLAGIAAPALDQTCGSHRFVWKCGEAARAELARLVDASPVICIARGRDERHDVALCYCGRSDLSERMVSAGLALTSGTYGSRYAATQTRAIESLAGIWRTSFVRPEDWRSGAR